MTTSRSAGTPEARLSAPPPLPSLLGARFGDSTDRIGPKYSRFLAPLVERARVLMTLTILSALGFATLLFIGGRKYEARVTLATVGSAKLLGGLDAGLASSLLAGASMSGIQSTPALVVQLAELQGVLYPIALSRVDTTNGPRVGDRILNDGLLARIRGTDVAKLDPAQAAKLVRSIANSSFDRQTGLIALSVQHRDSALARYVVQRIVAGVSAAFMNATRAQASELRAAQTQRVDSAERRLRIAEDRLLAFGRENRVVSDFSATYIQRQRLERDATLARTVYTQAVTDQEAALARELQDTPAVVVVDAIPDRLSAVPRRLVLKTLLWAALSFVLLAAALVARDLLRESAADPDERLRAALEGWPRVARLFR